MCELCNISNDMLSSFKKDYNENKTYKAFANAIKKNGIQDVAFNQESLINMQYTFSNEIETGAITNQMKSGRCWLFAGLNTLRKMVADNIKVKDFELSQNYQMFWDKLEKSNYFLENIIETIEEDTYSRVFMWLLQDPLGDGGQWDMFINLVDKYGVVPKHIMPETFHSKQTPYMNKILTLKLRENASILKKMNNNKKSMDEIRNEKQKMLNEIFRILCQCLGEPPTTFEFEYREDGKKDSKSGSFHRDASITPKEFFKKYVKTDLNDYVSIINAPTEDKPFNNMYTVKYLGNVKGGNEIKYLNVDSKTLKELALAQLKDDEPVWFGCDVEQMMERVSGIMDLNIYDFETLFNIDLKMSKADRLDYGESKLTHAMVFTGVNIVDGKSNKWKVENSWGEENGKKGFYIMSDDWFDEYMYQIVVNKKYLSKDLKKVLTQEAKVLPPWDPMGSLAKMK